MWRGVVVGMHLGHILSSLEWYADYAFKLFAVSYVSNVHILFPAEHCVNTNRMGFIARRDKGRWNGGEGALCLSWGRCDCDGIKGVHGWANQQDGDKHEAPASAPHRPLSLREVMDCVPLKASCPLWGLTGRLQLSASWKLLTPEFSFCIGSRQFAPKVDKRH